MEHTKSEIGYRISEARTYLLTLEEVSTTRAWFQHYERFQKAMLSVGEAFALIHPRHFEDAEHSQKELQGPRAFSRPVSTCAHTCSSKLLWGYLCPISSEASDVDHLWPYSLGGPTQPGNAVYLCKHHNQLKGADIHFYPFEEGLPNWFKKHVNRIAVIMRSLT